MSLFRRGAVVVAVVVVVVVFGVVGTSINIDVLKSELMLQSNSNALCHVAAGS